jgi:hypothetical protein
VGTFLYIYTISTTAGVSLAVHISKRKTWQDTIMAKKQTVDKEIMACQIIITDWLNLPDAKNTARESVLTL